MSWRAAIVSLMALAPALVVSGASAAYLAGAASNRMFWGAKEETLPEAVASRNVGEIVRLLGLGADPNRPATVREGFVSDDELVLTPLQAAVAKGHADLLQLLLDYGALPTTDDVKVLRCYAEVRRSGTRDMLAALSKDPWPDCREVPVP